MTVTVLEEVLRQAIDASGFLAHRARRKGWLEEAEKHTRYEWLAREALKYWQISTASTKEAA
ncbi:MAG: hypothetical protein WCD70_13425 [Alphaproteobacteria bacterium]